MRAVACVLVVACSPEPAGSTPTEGPDAPVDPIREAYGGCTITGEEVDEAGERVFTSTEVRDENGDRVTHDYDYADAPDSASVYEYGAAHEYTSWVVTVDGAPEDGWTRRWEWEGGQIVWEETDDGSDGALDETGRFEYDGEQLVYWEWDYEGDGAVDDTADWAWAAEGDGWVVQADGVDPNGPYSIVETADADLLRYTSVYEDATGLRVEWEVESYSALRVLGSWEKRWYLDDALILRETWEREHDAVGRVVREVATEEDETTGQSFGGDSTETTSWTYDCP